MLKNVLVLFSVSLLTATAVHAQKFYTKAGRIDFNATAPSSPEKIEAVNKTVTCVLDVATGNIQFAVLIKGFTFERALMQEHFNENYLESDKFPKAEFKGTITNNSAVNYIKDGDYSVTVKGKLTLHGETREVESSGKISVKGDKISASAGFSAVLGDYKVEVPTLVSDKLSKTAKITVACTLEPFKS
ncbi:MAG: YceI family protein [Sphingomonadales bacterium]